MSTLLQNNFTFKMLIIIKKIFIIAIITFITQMSCAVASSYDYTSAYQLCQPYADRAAKDSCSYGAYYEINYLYCMQQYGIDSNNLENINIAVYQQAYSYCSIIADSKTKESCLYSSVSRAYYDQCMRQYGFDADGQKLFHQEDNPQYFEFDF